MKVPPSSLVAGAGRGGEPQEAARTEISSRLVRTVFVTENPKMSAAATTLAGASRDVSLGDGPFEVPLSKMVGGWRREKRGGRG